MNITVPEGVVANLTAYFKGKEDGMPYVVDLCTLEALAKNPEIVDTVREHIEKQVKQPLRLMRSKEIKETMEKLSKSSTAKATK